MPARDRAVGVPANLGVIVGMQVYEPGGDDQAIHVDDLLGKAGRLPAELGNVAIANPHVGLVSRRPRPVDHRSAFNVEIKLSHRWFPPSMSGKDRSEILDLCPAGKRNCAHL